MCNLEKRVLNEDTVARTAMPILTLTSFLGAERRSAIFGLPMSSMKDLRGLINGAVLAAWYGVGAKEAESVVRKAQ